MVQLKTETIYVDLLFHCHRTDDGTRIPVETDFFVGKCDKFVEGHCYDTSKGYEQIYPWKSYSELDSIQRQYEKALIADMQNALSTLGVTLDE